MSLVDQQMLLFIDASKPFENNQGQQQLSLNFVINNGALNTPYQIRLSLKMPNDPQPVVLGYSNPHSADMVGKVAFNLTFIIDYFFHISQELIVEIAKGPQNLVIATRVSDVLAAKFNTITYPLIQNSNETITITGAPLPSFNKMIQLDVKLDTAYEKMFYVLKKTKANNTGIKESFALYKSEASQSQFKPMILPSSFLDYGNHDNSIIFDLYIKGNCVGSLEVTVSSLLNKLSSLKIQEFILYVSAKEFERTAKSFIQLLQENLQLNLNIGIDFTGSNGHYLDAGTLHYLSNIPNLYEAAIKECGEIVGAYDSDKIFPVYGFGALLPNSKEVSHCFPINLSNDPNIKGIDNVLYTYRSVVPKLTFSGPTLFSLLLDNMTAMVESTMSLAKTYTVILIMTDGVINDMDDTINSIIRASELPISIIIVGVGEADFSQMMFLDSDNKVLTSKSGKKAKRDIVQFVSYLAVKNNPKLLAEKILEELPSQVELYYNKL